MSGMLMSTMTRSQGCRGRTRRASNPLAASLTSMSPLSSSAARTKERIALLSSTMRTRRTATMVAQFQEDPRR